MAMGRPLIEIKPGEFEGLCAVWCTLRDIAGFFHCSEDTIERWCKKEYGRTFADVYKEFSARGTVSLRRAQFTKATVDKNPAMLIFLGKQKLGQSDQPVSQQSEETAKAISSIRTLLDKAKSKYDSKAASSSLSEQDGAAQCDEGQPLAADAPLPVKTKKPKAKPAKGKAPAKAVKSK